MSIPAHARALNEPGALVMKYSRATISQVQQKRGYYIGAAASGERIVLVRSGQDVAALVSRRDLNQLRSASAPADEPIGVSLTLFRAELSRFADKAARGQRYAITADHVGHTDEAALVSLDDLDRLRQMDSGQRNEPVPVDERDERFRRALQEAGVEVTWPTGEPVRDRISIDYDPHGEYLSEQIVRERG